MRRAVAAAAGLVFILPGVFVLLAGHPVVALVPLSTGVFFTLAGVLKGRASRGALSAALLISVSWCLGRGAIAHVPERWLVCEDDECSRRGPWWSRVLPEHASLDSGFLLSRVVARLSASELLSYSQAFAGPMSELPPVPNALVLTSSDATLRRLVVEPTGEGKLPCVVFLHGFGGLSSAYVRVLERALPGVVIVAPALDVAARWDSERGHRVVERTLETLPARADRQRTVLVGLSNGAVFGARYAPRFKGAVLVSGVGATGATKVPVLVVAGDRDERIPIDLVRDLVLELREQGVAVELDVVHGADHALLFTHAEHWARAVLRLMNERRSVTFSPPPKW
jgi:dienelactone hydrolase